MKHFTRIIAMLLMLACLFTCLIACNDSDNHKKPNPTLPENNGGNTPNGGEVTDPNGEELPPLPDPVNFGSEDGTPYTYQALIRTGTAGPR